MTPKQPRLRKEIEDIASILKMDHWNIRDWDPRRRTSRLQMTKDKLIRGHVVYLYTLIDQLLTAAIWSYYFPAEPRWADRTFPQLWRMKRFRTFNHYLMEETFLQKKLSLVYAIRKVPKNVFSAISRRSAERSGAWVLSRATPKVSGRKKVMYDRADIFSKDGVEKFTKDVDTIRTCRFPASGSRTRHHAFTHGTSCPSAVRRTSPKYPFVFKYLCRRALGKKR